MASTTREAAREAARLLGFRSASGGDDELAAMSRRVLCVAVALTLAGGGLAAWAWGPNAALTLTATGLVSSFSFRGLEMQVRALEPDADGRAGARNTLISVLRHTLLIAFVVLALVHGSLEFVALILGFSVVPLALVLSELGRRLGAVGVAARSRRT